VTPDEFRARVVRLDTRNAEDASIAWAELQPLGNAGVPYLLAEVQRAKRSELRVALVFVAIRLHARAMMLSRSASQLSPIDARAVPRVYGKSLGIPSSLDCSMNTRSRAIRAANHAIHGTRGHVLVEGERNCLSGCRASPSVRLEVSC
jgi:hypothetical protein